MPAQASFPSQLAALRRLQTLNAHVYAPLRRTGTGRITNGSWTCASCRSSQLSASSSYNSTLARRTFATSSKRYSNQSSNRSSSSSSNTSGKTNNGRRTMLLAAGGGAAATAGLLAFGDDVKYTYEAVERTGRVATALAACVNDYRKTLNLREKIEHDPEEKQRLLKECHQRCADRTLEVLEKSGGIFIKLGQHLSAMNYLLPPEWTTTFIPLQDKCPVSSFESIERMFLEDTGTSLWDYFSEFSREPIGAASLAQVHLATIKETGQRVAVKVQHPSLQRWAPLDMRLTATTFKTLKYFFPEYDLEWLSSEVEISLPKELDFTCEAENARRTAAHFAQAAPQLPLLIPDVLWAKKRLLVMACESGHRLDDLAYMDSHGIDRDEVSATLAHIFNEMIFGEGAPLHCDPHGGNIAIRHNPSKSDRGKTNFDIILYDHGLYRDIPLPLRRSYAKLWLAIIDGDVPRMKQYAYEVAGIGEDKFPLFASAITGRDFINVVSATKSGGVMKPKEASEQKSMSTALQEGMIVDLVQMLGQVPRIILLILKTNDLTRALDESLHTRQGPVRQFLILARYCMRTVFYERLEEIRKLGSVWSNPNKMVKLVGAWWELARVEVKVQVFELWLRVKRALGLGGNVLGQQQVPVGKKGQKRLAKEVEREIGELVREVKATV
ncbi:ABC1 family-domain-containing protein [Pseudoneurospora amorphoporcata]|uniref:ABC1 family-domain-containing protein n=1 Tax=Pseudoneurospora amorphoporcata TaxID=241081 RepID=A0AAN6P782_9PEZI|nr:ABC1 family-domain-containing protein [Pseudoneurospora amorphoporcata]